MWAPGGGGGGGGGADGSLIIGGCTALPASGDFGLGGFKMSRI